MSIRAYKIIRERETETKASFNVGEDFDLIENLASHSGFNQNGECISMEFNIKDLRTRVNTLEREMMIINQVIKDGERNDFVGYDCY